QLHHEIGPAGFGRPSFKDLGNVWVVHQGQGLALRLETGNHFPGIHPEFDDLQRDAPFDRFLLLGQVNHAETATADLLQEFVAPDLITWFFAWRRPDVTGEGTLDVGPWTLDFGGRTLHGLWTLDFREPQ